MHHAYGTEAPTIGNDVRLRHSTDENNDSVLQVPHVPWLITKNHRGGDSEAFIFC